MSATVIHHPAGTARPLRSGGYAVDVGDAFPTWVPDRDHARDLLDVRAANARVVRRSTP